MARSVNGFVGTFNTLENLIEKYSPSEHPGCSANIGVDGTYTKVWSNGTSWNYGAGFDAQGGIVGPNGVVLSGAELAGAKSSISVAGVSTLRASGASASGISGHGGLIASMGSPGYDGRTYQSILTAESSYVGVRVRVRNAEATAYTLDACAVAASATLTIAPTGSWVPVTWAGASSVSIPARIAANRPSETVSDLIPLRSVARTDGGLWAQPYCHVRAYNATGPKSGYIGSTAQPTRAGWGAATSLNRGRIFHATSGVGNFVASNQAGLGDDSGNFSAMAIELEFVYLAPAMTVGLWADSIGQGDGASIVHASYAFKACADLSTMTRPVTLRNHGWSNMTSQNFAERMSDDFAAGRVPNVSIFHGFTPNDGAPTQASIDGTLAQVMRMVDLCRRYRSVPVCMIGLPRSYTGSNETFRQAHLATLRSVLPTIGVTVLDGDGILAATPGGNAMSAADAADSIHPTDAGNDKLLNGANGYAGLRALLQPLANVFGS